MTGTQPQIRRRVIGVREADRNVGFGRRALRIADLDDERPGRSRFEVERRAAGDVGDEARREVARARQLRIPGQLAARRHLCCDRPARAAAGITRIAGPRFRAGGPDDPGRPWGPWWLKEAAAGLAHRDDDPFPLTFVEQYSLTEATAELMTWVIVSVSPSASVSAVPSVRTLPVAVEPAVALSRRLAVVVRSG